MSEGPVTPLRSWSGEAVVVGDLTTGTSATTASSSSSMVGGVDHSGSSSSNNNNKNNNNSLSRQQEVDASSSVITHMTSDSSIKDILQELYWYVIRDAGISADELHVRHVVECLKAEGLLFWRDGRFNESQDILLQRVSDSSGTPIRAALTGQIIPQAQEAASNLPLDYNAFVTLVAPCARLFLQALSEELVIPDWSTFVTDMTYHFCEVANHTDGRNAQYIPILRDADPNKWGLAMCSTDGQRFAIGDTNVEHSLQSVSKPVTYALGLAKEGPEFMEQWIDVEPAGRPFNTQDLDPVTQRPFNASVNSGAIMAAGVLASGFPNYTWREVVDHVRAKWYEICGHDLPIGFSPETFQSEKSTAYNNFAIAYNLKGRRGLPRDVDLLKMLDVYLGCCSIQITTEALSVAAATLANGGVCPITGQEVFPAEVVRSVLAEIMTCGMYDQAGAFAVQVGLPAKSGVSGALMVIVPNVFGFATFSPRLNGKGNSVRGIEFCKRLVRSYRVHIFEPLRSGNTGAKIDPRQNGWKDERMKLSRLAWATQVGDAYAVRLRDIFLLALSQTAMALPEGLSDRMLSLIQRNYEQVYQFPVDEQLFTSIVDAVRQHPTELRFLEKLTQDIYIVDSMRSIIITAMVDIILADGNNETAKSVGARIAQILGIDADVARMEMNRLEQHVGHRYKDVEYCNMIECIGGESSHRRSISELGSSRHSAGAVRQSLSDLLTAESSTSQPDGALTSVDVDESSSQVRQPMQQQQQPQHPKQAIQELQQLSTIGSVLDQEGGLGGDDEQNQEILFLRKEILRLRRRVATLTTILHERTGPANQG